MEKNSIIKELKNLRDSFQALVLATESNTEFWANLPVDYPFTKSLDEVSNEVSSFVETQIKLLEKSKTTYKHMRFGDFVQKELIENEEEYDAVIGDVDMNYTMCACSHWKLTEYCWQKYWDLLNADCYVIPVDDEHFSPTVVCEEASDALGNHFCAALAGYTGAKEFDKLFGTHDADEI